MSDSENHHEKYDSKNPIAQKMLQGFMDSLTELTQQYRTHIHTITECGCGQGHVNRHIEKLFPESKIKGFDINELELNIAKSNQMKASTELYCKSIYDITTDEKADLIVCCEVLEHLEEPLLALKKMSSLNAKYYVFSVPREPLWRILNMMRGKYIKKWGNTPDHRNHWSTRGFIKFISQEMDVIKINKPLPWTMILAQPKHHD